MILKKGKGGLGEGFGMSETNGTASPSSVGGWWSSLGRGQDGRSL